VEEAIQQLQIADKGDPLFTLFLGDALADAGRDGEAAAVCEKLPPDNPNGIRMHPPGPRTAGGAGQVIQIYEGDPGQRRVGAALGCAYARTGRHQEAETVAANTAMNPGAMGVVEIFACLGDKERVFDALDRQVAVGPIRIGWVLLRVDRENRGLLRGDPRLKALRRKVGLPE